MKKLFILIFAMGLSFNIVSKEQAETPLISYSEQELNLLKDKYEKLMEENTKVIQMYNSIINDLKEERKNHQDFVECLYKWATGIIGIIFAIAIGIFSFLGWRRFKDIDESIKEAADKAKEKAFKELANKLKTAPEVLEEVIKDKSVEMALKKTFHIFILKHPNVIDKAPEMKRALFAFGFENVQVVNMEQAININFSRNNVVVLFDQISNNTLIGKIKRSDCAVFGYGNIRKSDLELYVTNPECINFCSSFATLYHNLMSLLLYKQEINKGL